jgi:hypothetical protein
MWDGRGSSPLTGTQPIGELPPVADIPTEVLNQPANLIADLKHQSLDATLGHSGSRGPAPISEVHGRIPPVGTSHRSPPVVVGGAYQP